MKKVAVIIVFIFVFFLTACSLNEEHGTMLGTIIKEEEQWMFLEERGVKRFYIDDPKVSPGSKVEVFYKGEIEKGSPSHFSQQPEIKLLEERNDYYSFYKKFLQQLWENDQDLNYRVKTIYYDISKIESLTQAEKNWLMASFQDEIDKKSMSLEDILDDREFSDEYGNIRAGVHIEIMDEITGEGLITQYKKTRANLGAIGRQYKSTYNNGKWSMTLEGEWAS